MAFSAAARAAKGRACAGGFDFERFPMGGGWQPGGWPAGGMFLERGEVGLDELVLTLAVLRQ